MRKFIFNCKQLKGLKYDFEDLDNNNLEPLKRKIFEDYKSTLMSMKKSLADKSIL